MNKAKSTFLTILVMAFIVLLGLYAVGIFDFANISYARNQEYDGGLVYNGGLLEGRYSGYGSVSFEDGDNYNGWFKEGRFDGSGIYRHLGNEDNENWLFDGEFKEGQAVRGVFYFEDGYSVAYDRDSSENLPSSQKIIRIISENGEQTIIYD
jgi:hypothetical protein